MNYLFNSQWQKLLSAFCSLGGVAENICQKNGENGRGIFPENLQAESRIFVPSELLIPVNDISLDCEVPRIKPKAKHTRQTRDFFEFYQETFSWGLGGKDSTENFEGGLRSLPEEVKETFKKLRLTDIDSRHSGPWDIAIYNRFISARQFNYNNQTVIAPVLELVNHEVKSNPFQILHNGISTPKTTKIGKELTHKYGNMSPLFRALKYGFVCKEPTVFSFPFSFPLDNSLAILECEGKSLIDDSMKFYRKKDVLIFDGLPIADLISDNLPLNYLAALMRRAGVGSCSSALFQKIFNFNKEKRKQLLKQLNNNKTNTSEIIKEALIIELEIMSSSAI
tara:strand:+ start:400 stop:1410 length:1011 start_codon:yes stop_codon:yes gene_type:complete